MSETKPSLAPGKLPLNGELTAAACYIILTAAFLGWMFSGFQMAVMTLCARSATTEFLRRGQLTAQEPLRLSRLWSPPPIRETSPAIILSEAKALQSLVPRWFSHIEK